MTIVIIIRFAGLDPAAHIQKIKDKVEENFSEGENRISIDVRWWMYNILANGEENVCFTEYLPNSLHLDWVSIKAQQIREKAKDRSEKNRHL